MIDHDLRLFKLAGHCVHAIRESCVVLIVWVCVPIFELRVQDIIGLDGFECMIRVLVDGKKFAEQCCQDKNFRYAARHSINAVAKDFCNLEL